MTSQPKLPLSKQMMMVLSTTTLTVIATDLRRAADFRSLSEDESALYEAVRAELHCRGLLG